MVESKNIFLEDQDNWLGVGMLLYLVKYSCSNLANMTRELSKTKDGAKSAAYKDILCVIKYVLDMKDLGFKIEPMRNSKEPWEIICFSNINHVGDLVSRQTISGFILYVLNIPASWQFNLQKNVYLSSSEC